MQYKPYDPLRNHAPVYDPLSVTGTALASLGGGSAASGGILALTGLEKGLSAVNSMDSGSYAAQAGAMKQAAANTQADVDVQNSAGEIAMAQRQALDALQKANLQRSSAVASAAAGGVNAGAGSALGNQAGIANAGQQTALQTLWQGQNRSTGLLNQAAAQRFAGAMDNAAGQQAQSSDDLQAASTIAGGGASLLRQYGNGGAPPSVLSSTDFGNGGARYPMYT